MKDQKTKEQFIELRASGLSFDKIAEKLEVSRNTLISWSSTLEVEIMNATQIQLESIREAWLLTKTAKLEAYGKQLAKISAALAERDFEGLDTKTLMDLFFRLHSATDTAGVTLNSRENLLDTDMRYLRTWTA